MTPHRLFNSIFAIAAAALAFPAAAERLLQTFQISDRTIGASSVNLATHQTWIDLDGNVAVHDAATGRQDLVPNLRTGGGFAIDPVTNRLFVATGGSELTVVDAVTFARTRVTIGNGLGRPVIDAARRKLYAVSNLDNLVVIVDADTLATASVPVAAGPSALTVNPATGKVYAAHPDAGVVTALDPSTLATTTLAVGPRPTLISTDPGLNRVYVADSTLNVVHGFDGATHAPLGTRALPSTPVALAANPATGRLYALHSGYFAAPRLQVFDGTFTAIASIVVDGDIVLTLGVNAGTNTIYVGSIGYIGIGGSVGPRYLNAIDGVTHGVRQVGLHTNTGLEIDPVANRVLVTAAFTAQVSTFRIKSANTYYYDGARFETTTVATGTAPGAAVVLPSAGRVLVANSGAGTLTVIDTDTGTGSPVAVGANPTAIAVNARTRRAYVANRDVNTVSIVQLPAGAVTTVNVGAGPAAVAVNAVTNRIYVANATSGTVSEIDGANGSVQTIAVGADPAALAVDETLDRIYVANRGSDTVTIIDGPTRGTTPVVVGDEPSAIAVNPATGKVYVANRAAGTVSIIRPDTNAVSTVTVGTQPSAIAIHPAVGLVYIANAGSASVTLIDAVSDGSGAIPVAANPGAIAVDVARDRVYIAFPGNGTVGVHGLVLDAAVSITVGTGPGAIAVDPTTSKAYVTNAGSANVTVLGEQRATPAVLATTIAPLPDDATTSPMPAFTFSATAGHAGTPATTLWYQVDRLTGPWLKASGTGPFTATLPRLAPGTHVLYAFAADGGIAAQTRYAGAIAAYVFTVATDCRTAACTDLAVSQALVSTSHATGRDILVDVTVSNAGSVTANGARLRYALPPGTAPVWSSIPCDAATVAFSCLLGDLASGAQVKARLVVRPSTGGLATLVAHAASAVPDGNGANDASALSVAVTQSPIASAVPRYRLYSPVTFEHHFTTSVNEYNALGALVGTWVKEGTVGKVYDHPGYLAGDFFGAEATPYYRLYNASNRQHHWTTDANEYYTLIQFPQYSAEGVDGFIFQAPVYGTIPLYRLLYPFSVPVSGLHHWTIDPVEYNALITSFGWVGEGGSGFVIP